VPHSSPERRTSVRQFVVSHLTGELAGNSLVVCLHLLSESLHGLPATQNRVPLEVQPDPCLLVRVPRRWGGWRRDGDCGCAETWMIPLKGC